MAGKSSKHIFRLSIIASFALHVMVFSILASTATTPPLNRQAMETFIVSPSSALKLATPYHLRNTTETTPESHYREVARPLPTEPVPLPSLAAQVHVRSPDHSIMIQEPALAPAPTAPVTAKTGNSQSETPGTSTHVAETERDLSLGESGAPRFIRQELPAYPFLARKLGKEGKVILRVTLDEMGKQKDIEIIARGGFGFTEAAVQALTKSIFSPAIKQGKPVRSRILVPISFALNDKEVPS